MTVETTVGGIDAVVRASLAVLDRATAEPACRLVVDVDHQIAYLDGTPHELGTLQGALFVDQIVRGQGRWVSARNMREADSQLYGVRKDRLRLPHPVQELIESHPGQGHRLTPEALTQP